MHLVVLPDVIELVMQKHTSSIMNPQIPLIGLIYFHCKWNNFDAYVVHFLGICSIYSGAQWNGVQFRVVQFLDASTNPLIVNSLDNWNR